MKYEVIVIGDKVYTYPTTWADVTETAHKVGLIHNRIIVSVYCNGQWFCDKFTNV